MKQLLPFMLIVVATSAQQTPIETTKRLPAQKKQITLESPRVYLKRVLRVDPQTGEEILYDPKPRIELVDAKAGRYHLKWIGYDGKEKVIIYQRPDAIDVVVSATVVRNSTGRYAYEYTIQNLVSSGEYLAGFEVQTFSSDIVPNKLPIKIDNISIGEMSNNIPEFKEGRWIHFAPLPPRPRVNPGQSIAFQLTSSSPAGLVMCRVNGGDFVMQGVGEEMPQELENVLPRYEALPSGYTIGPVDELKAFTVKQRAKYLRKRLPQFQQLGWIVNGLVTWYEQNLKGDNLEQVFNRATTDFKEGRITSELLAMIEFNR